MATPRNKRPSVRAAGRNSAAGTRIANRLVEGRGWLAVLSCMVLLVTFLVLMVPAISITDDVASEDNGFFFDNPNEATVEAFADEDETDSGSGEEDEGKDAENPDEGTDADDTTPESGGDGSGEGEAAGASGKAGSSTSDAGDDIRGEKPAEETASGGDAGNASDGDADNVSDGDAGDVSDDDAGDVSDGDKDVQMPAQSFREELKNKNHEVTLTVAVEAPEGAFAEGTTMRIKKVPAAEVRDSVDAAIRDDESVQGEVKSLTAVDISFYDAEDEKVEPAKPVEVKITTEKVRDIDNPVLVHVADPAEDAAPEELREAEVIEKVEIVNEDETRRIIGAEDTLKFESDAFSVYAIVEVEDPVSSFLQQLVDKDFTLSIKNHTASPVYFGSTIKVSGSNSVVQTADLAHAGVWHLELVEGESNQCYLYVEVNGQKQYLYALNPTNNNNVSLSPENKTAFEVSTQPDDTFHLKAAGVNRWLQYSGSGGGFRLYTDANNADNSRISINATDVTPIGDDPFGLDGKTYGLGFNDNSAASAALMAAPANNNHLAAQNTVIRPDVLDNEGVLLVAENTDITMWTFHSSGDGKYTVSADVDGATKYLKLANASLTLVDEADATQFSIEAGSGENAGKFQLSAGSYQIAADMNKNDASKGFYGNNKNLTSSWLNLLEKSILPDDAFKVWRAKKVSVSDTVNVYGEEVYRGDPVPDDEKQKVVVYTRVWNDNTSRYDFYAVDHDGSLIRCYSDGDGIEWTGTTSNSALWVFTEYVDDSGNATTYYELKNEQYGNYFAPQLTDGGQIFSDGPFGINLNGRSNGEDYTTITAWDAQGYGYTGLKVEDGHVVSGAFSDACDFYFAIMKEEQEDPEDPVFTEVNTLDNNDYGITMKMIDFNNTITNNRDSAQWNYFGGDHSGQNISGESGLLSTELVDGYPYRTIDGLDNKPLSDLFNGTQTVNHLFIESIHSESGYFEYDSTSNFASLLDENGNVVNDFTVYDQLGGIKGYPGQTGTGRHGQFMPYSALTNQPCEFANTTDVLGNELPYSDTRKGETLYCVSSKQNHEEPGSNAANAANAVDYFFGMQMQATFTQTSSGLDAWGHDIIFEFSGDDDFWLYVDGELALDLGGVHRAQEGFINFRTGEVYTSRLAEPTTLRRVFTDNYRKRHPEATQEAIDDYLTNTLHLDPNSPNGVFQDFTKHTMTMFYMERGAGASNLHMRFNLASVKEGSFLLSKELSGSASESNNLIEFPYQIWCKEAGTSEFRLFGSKAGERGKVTYEGSSSRMVKYEQSFKPAGCDEEYQHVFFLKPGETAEVALPKSDIDAGITEYYVVECGVNPSIYDKVFVNTDEDPIAGTHQQTCNCGRCDYATDAATTDARPAVRFKNQVSDEALRTLSITKKLYDETGQHVVEYPDNKTLFNFRLYLGDEYTNPDDLKLANRYPYYVKDTEGHYCQWSRSEQKFESLPYTTYDELAGYLQGLSAAEKESVIFVTGSSGTITKIPAGYTVEVRDLVAGTSYKVEEWDNEIPKGYTLRMEDGYTRVDNDTEVKYGTEPISGTMTLAESPDEEDPAYEVRNQKGWGLTVQKAWTDADFMESHDPIYFAVYKKGAGGELTFVEDSVRKLEAPATEVYYFFDKQQQEGTTFDKYVVREVTVTESEDGEGHVAYSNVVPIGDGETLTVGGTPVGGSHQDGIPYTVTYHQGEPTTDNENVRTDKVTNSRPGIELYKTKWNGEALSDAVFTLTDENGDSVAKSRYVSDEDGLITVAYLKPGTYTLTETATPNGYAAANKPLTFTVSEDKQVTVSGIGEEYYVLDLHEADSEMLATIKLKNRTSALRAMKLDASTSTPTQLAGAHFALHRQVSEGDGTLRPDYEPIEGFEDLVSGDDGVIPKITLEDVPRGTYYLRETEAPGDFDRAEDLCFTIGQDGRVVVNTDAYASWLDEDMNSQTGLVTYTIRVPNGKMKKLSFKKIDATSQEPLAGASFDLYPVVGDSRSETPLMTDLVSDENGMLKKGNATKFNIPSGDYELVETNPPAGYNPMSGAVTVHVTRDNGVTWLQPDYESGAPQTAQGEGTDGNPYQVVLRNTNHGVELPSTGGMGLLPLYALGTLMVAVAGAFLLLRARRA